MGSAIMANNGLRLCVILFDVTLTPNMSLCVTYITSLSSRVHVASISNGSPSLPMLKGSRQKPEGSCFRVALEMTTCPLRAQVIWQKFHKSFYEGGSSVAPFPGGMLLCLRVSRAKLC